MSNSLSVLARNAACAAIVKLIDGGSKLSTGRIEIRTGTKPTSPESPAVGTLLSTMAFSNPAFTTPQNGKSAANPITPDNSVAASGLAGWFRCFDRDGNAIFDGDIGTTGSAADIQFDDPNLLAGGSVTIGQYSVAVPSAC